MNVVSQAIAATNEYIRTSDAVEVLQSKVAGQVYLPTDPGYEAARKSWNLAVDQYPAVILVAATSDDVAEGVNFANIMNLGVAVQATGHGGVVAGNDALLIITSKLIDVEINAGRNVAIVGAGAEWYMVLAEAQKYGLAPLLGSSPYVGVTGYTLGGGMGWLARKYGLALDSVNAFEVVTMDGAIMRVSHDSHSDLFWGLCGAGGALAIVTRIEMRLYPVTTVYGGNLMYPASMAKEVMTRFGAWVRTVPEELTCSVALMNFPPLPDVPAIVRGQSFVIVRGCYTGDLQKGADLVQEWLDWKTPVLNTWAALPFTQVGHISNEPKDPMPAKSSGAWLSELTDEVIDTLIQGGLAANGSPLVMTEVRLAGGAIARVPAETNAYSHRQAPFSLQLVGVTPHIEATAAVTATIDEIKAALRPYTVGIYRNFVEGDEALAKTNESHSAYSFQWLMVLKAAYDPKNLLRYHIRLAYR